VSGNNSPDFLNVEVVPEVIGIRSRLIILS
jgi:hypothetical protein